VAVQGALRAGVGVELQRQVVGGETFGAAADQGRQRVFAHQRVQGRSIGFMEGAGQVHGASCAQASARSMSSIL
jgi:hypothetical protein